MKSSSLADLPSETSRPAPPSRRSALQRASNQFAAAIRWLHIYVSLLGFSSLMFFGATGVTLNHPDWFGSTSERTRELQGHLSPAWLAPVPTATIRQGDSGPQNSDVTNAEGTEGENPDAVAKLEIVEFLRKECGLRGAVSEFRVDDQECLILFKGPAYAADVIINRATAEYTVTETASGLVALINDLHKGRDSGPIWSWLIDVSAVVTVIVSVTGIVLILYIRRKRWSGLITATLGTLLMVALYLFGVP